MLPVFFSLGPITVYSYGVMLFLGFLLGLFIIWKRSREENFEEEQVFDAIMMISLYALAGARLVYVILNFSAFGANVLSWINIIGKPGFSLFGALGGGIAGLYLQNLKRKWDFFEFADIVAVGLSLIFTLGWLGAFLNGTSPGIETDSPLGVTFAGVYQKRFPVQIYFSFLYLLLFIYLWWVEGKYRTFDWYSGGKSGAKPGFIFFSLLFSSGLFGVLLSPLMPDQAIILGISSTAWAWTIILLVGLLGIYLRSGRNLSTDINQVVSKTERSQKRRKRLRQRKKIRKLGSDIF